MQAIERTIEVIIHGRYLVASEDGALRMSHSSALTDTVRTPTRRWSVFNPSPDANVSIILIQGLHRFYRGRSNEVVASWMTSQSRMFAIADNISYVGGVIERVFAERR